ncbi:PREDICTED: interleukin-9 receptor-like, partial [Elephantulus edwardii]|uniref:interleukin-9 receptor-like n=1 Tax=Elephantulus edwardii TaxID=28737 RepID=UPI0003F0ED4C
MAQGRHLGGRSLADKVLMRKVGIQLLVCACVYMAAALPEGGGRGGGEGRGGDSPLQECQLPVLQPDHSLSVTVPELELGTVTCLNNNILRIDCYWSAPGLSVGGDAWLLLISEHAAGSKHKCIFRAGNCSVELPPQEVLVPSDSFTIMLHRCVAGQEQVSLVDPQYLPRRHVKLDPPLDLQSNVSSDYCILTWSVSAALEPMTWLFAYQLAFKREQQAWEQAHHKDHIVGVTRLVLEAVELDPDSAYEARLRVQMVQEDDMDEEERYEGPWSEWSPSVRFLAPQRQGSRSPPWERPDGALIAVSIFLLMTSLTYFLFKLSPRVKRTFHQDVPSPAAFFQPLYTVHHGNFQTWTGTQRVGQAAEPGGSASNHEVVAPLTCTPGERLGGVNEVDLFGHLGTVRNPFYTSLSLPFPDLVKLRAVFKKTQVQQKARGTWSLAPEALL